MKLEDISNFFSTLSKDPRVAMGIIFTAVPTIFGAGYIGITKYNEVVSIINSYGDTTDDISKANKKIALLEQELANVKERSNAQSDTIVKLQDRTGDALIDAREAKTMAESTQKEVRAMATATDVQLKSLGESIKSELNSIKRANTNPLGR